MTNIPKTTLEWRVGKAAGLQHLTLKEASIPALKATEVLVEVHAVSLQYRDTKIISGTFPLQIPIKQKVIPGSDLAGTIVALGSEVKGWKEGERVMSNFNVDHIYGDLAKEALSSALGGPIDGVLTQYKILPARALVHIPDSLSFEEASTLPCAALAAYNALMGPVKLKAGDYVLVEGTGGVSTFALQLAVASGAAVIATSSSDLKLEIARKLGTKHTINYKSYPEWHEEVLKITNGRGVDRVVEVGGPGTLRKAIKSTRIGGLVAVVGFVGGAGETDGIVTDLIGGAAMLRGQLIGSRTQFEDMVRLIEANGVKPYIDKVFKFDQLKEALEYQATQKHVGKIVINVADY